MSKTIKTFNKAIGKNEKSNMNNCSILSAQPITLNFIDSHHHMNININTNGKNSQETNKGGSAKKNRIIDLSQISGPTGFRVVRHVDLAKNNFEVSFTLYLKAKMPMHSDKRALKVYILDFIFPKKAFKVCFHYKSLRKAFLPFTIEPYTN
jgi:hypothetical protein